MAMPAMTGVGDHDSSWIDTINSMKNETQRMRVEQGIIQSVTNSLSRMSKRKQQQNKAEEGLF